MSKYKYITGTIIINDFGNEIDHSGEADGFCDFDFKLIEPIEVSYCGEKYVFDRIKYQLNMWAPPLSFCNKAGAHAELPIPTALAREVYELLVSLEQGNGKLKDWCFSDDLEKVAYRERFNEYGSRKHE